MAEESFLDGLEITDQPVSGPYFGILYGPAGVGKSFLCQYAPNPFFIAVEKGVEKVPNVGRFTKNGQIVMPTDINQFFEMLRYFVSKKHDYKTVVIDSGKFVDTLICADVIKNNPTETKHKQEIKIESIGDYNFGTGYTKAISYWTRFIAGVDALNRRGINVILIAHAHERNTTNINGDDYKKTKIDLLEFGSSSVPNLLYARADWTYLMRSEAHTRTVKNAFGASKTIAQSGGVPEITIYTRSTNSFDAKVRTGNIDNIPDAYEIDIRDESTSKQIFIDLEK